MARRAGDIGDVVVARESGHLAFSASSFPGTQTVEDDEKRRQARKDAGVTAILHEGHPVRYWDHDLGPAESARSVLRPAPVGDGRLAAVRDLTPDAQGNVGEGLAVSPDGRTLAVEWRIDDGRGGASRLPCHHRRRQQAGGALWRRKGTGCPIRPSPPTAAASRTCRRPSATGKRAPRRSLPAARPHHRPVPRPAAAGHDGVAEPPGVLPGRRPPLLRRR